MRTSFLILSLLTTLSSFSQYKYLDYYKQDTLQIPVKLNYKKYVALEMDSAFIILDYDYFKAQLETELKACKRQLKDRNEDKDPNYKWFLKALNNLDSVFIYLRTKKESDTVFVNFKSFGDYKFGRFIPSLIETSKCAITDHFKVAQSKIIRQRGSRKNGQFEAFSTLYFIQGQSIYFWSRWDGAT